MADLTKAQLATRVLQYLGVLGVGHSATAADAALVQEAVDSAHDELRKVGLAPFGIDEIPEWAQPGLRDYVIAEVKPAFGKPMTPMQKQVDQLKAKQQLQIQTAAPKHELRTRAKYF